jgi:hypothetical protein
VGRHRIALVVHGPLERVCALRQAQRNDEDCQQRIVRRIEPAPHILLSCQAKCVAAYSSYLVGLQGAATCLWPKRFHSRMTYMYDYIVQ